MQLAVLLHSVHAFYSIQTSRSVLTYSAGRLFFVNNQIVPSCNNLGSNRQERRGGHPSVAPHFVKRWTQRFGEITLKLNQGDKGTVTQLEACRKADITMYTGDRLLEHILVASRSITNHRRSIN